MLGSLVPTPTTFKGDRGDVYPCGEQVIEWGRRDVWLWCAEGEVKVEKDFTGWAAS